MGMYKYDEPYKQHLSLSTYAWNVIERDRMSFSVDGTLLSLAGLLNRIFMSFYARSEASLPTRLSEKRHELNNALHGVKKEQKQMVVDALINAYEDELKAKIFVPMHESLAKTGKPFTIQKKMYERLISLKKEGYFLNEAGSDMTSGKYIAAVFEEYARQPYCQREQVYFQETVTTVTRAVRLGCELIVTQSTEDKKLVRHRVIPYGLQTDKLSMYNYLVGFSRKIDEPDDNFKQFGVRLFKIVNAEIDETQASNRLNNDMRKSLKNFLAKHDAMFLSDADRSQSTVVKLTEKGQRYYREQIHMRPQYIEITGDDANVYVFDCPMRQAEYYFFKFGKEAEILSPNILRSKFIKMYREAAMVYAAHTL